MQNIKLLCLPYAGGSSSVYLKWKKYLNNSIQLHTVELAGRGSRTGIPLYTSVKEAVKDIFDELKSNFDEVPYALFGHSMGVVIIYELINKIYQTGVETPVHVFLSGRNPPHIREKRTLHNLSDDEFRVEISKLGGTPREFFKHEKLLDLFLPLLKADLKLIETHGYSCSNNKWDIDISVLNGKDDAEVVVSRGNEWKEYTTKKCHMHVFEGGHFYINDYTDRVVNVINDTLISIC